VLRVFPLWPDFQPLVQLYSGHGRPRELRHGEEPLPSTEAGRAGISEEMMGRFAAFADLAQEYGLGLIVGLLTGWMSGRLFVPPAFEGRNVLTDPLVVKWQVRFVRCFVRRFRDHPAILAWDLGNECNCTAPVPSGEAAWMWTATIVNAIRAQDAGRPIVSGMHSLDEPNRDAAHWRIEDQGELTDLLTTHPYPIFTPHCDQDPINTIRSGLHATAQSCWYADVGGKPCLAEEVGTLGPMISSEEIAADYARVALFSLWAHGCRGLLWWCAYDQDHLAHAPYDWHSYERELGLIRADRTRKPVLDVIGQFGRFVRDLPVGVLPPRVTEAVCILTRGQDQWGTAFASFILAGQAGFDLEFQYAGQPLKEAGLYLVPAVCGGQSMSRRFWLELEERIRAGATLYLSCDDALLSSFNGPFGLEVQTRERRTGPAGITLDGLPGAPAYLVASPFRLRLEATHAEVLGREQDGNPAFTHASLGKGSAYFLSVPIERHLSDTPGAFHGPEAQSFWRIYRHVARQFVAGRVVAQEDPGLLVTEHPIDEERRVVVALNARPEPVEGALTLATGWKPGDAWYGSPPRPDGDGWRCAAGASDAAVFTVERA
jgi:hypothetical protein